MRQASCHVSSRMGSSTCDSFAYSLVCFPVSDLIFVILFRRGSKNHVTLLLSSFCINIATMLPHLDVWKRLVILWKVSCDAYLKPQCMPKNSFYTYFIKHKNFHEIVGKESLCEALKRFFERENVQYVFYYSCLYWLNHFPITNSAA